MVIIIQASAFRNGKEKPVYRSEYGLNVPEKIPDELNVKAGYAVRDTMQKLRTAGYDLRAWELRITFRTGG